MVGLKAGLELSDTQRCKTEWKGALCIPLVLPTEPPCSARPLEDGLEVAVPQNSPTKAAFGLYVEMVLVEVKGFVAMTASCSRKF